MTPLRQKYIRDLTIRGKAENTQQVYTACVADLASYYNRSPDLLTYDQVADWLFHLRDERKLAKSPHSLAGVFTDPRVWMMSAIYFCFVMGQYGLTFWMPTLVKATGVKGNFNTGLLSAIPFLFAVVVMILAGRSADKRGERRWHLIIPAFCGAVGFVVAALYADNTVVAIAFLSLAAGGVLTCAPLFWSLPTAFLRGSAAAAGIAAINSIGNLAGFVSPYLIGFLKDFTLNNRSGMYMFAGMLVLGAFLVLRTRPEEVNH